MTEDQPRPDLPEPEAQQPEPTEPQEVHAGQAQEKPLWKALTIRTLRATIGVLESTVEKLEAPPQPVPTPSPQEATPEFEDGQKSATVSPAPASPEVPQEAPLTAAKSATQEPSEATESVETGVEAPSPKRGWERVLERVRAFLPPGLNNLVPDWALTGVIVGSAVAIAWVSFFYLPDRLAEEIAEAPSPEAEVEVAPELEPPTEPQPAPTQPTPAPPPQLELTPEQSLIAAIQEQVTEITRQYAEGLIQSLTANFRQSRLVVTASEQWYELAQARQNQLANEILDRSRKLDFNKLEIVDPQGTLLARSPVVGDKMVILKREKLATLLDQSNGYD